MLEHAIHLFQTGEVQVDNQISSCSMKATAKTPLKLNKVSRKESLSTLAFSKQNWGMSTHNYFTSISKCDDAALSEIIAMAQALIMPSLEMSLDDGSFHGNLMDDEFYLSDGLRLNIPQLQSSTLCGIEIIPYIFCMLSYPAFAPSNFTH
ncbi:hypothetical protein F5J12DRAFT_779047 [Pisolithus orientalis]|uniref:uncharacterized protein n=1 Tax=Pisolithus orientalis TaxID=936130 RepID=UPI002224A948|nr:uncharacterized protein F5J12DRAFT_779047 [Pisolithus orientalis]KAI6032562.1 hypothetical protein F5J12DRAFT_779047 [Pisolithus orientalis]